MARANKKERLFPTKGVNVGNNLTDVITNKSKTSALKTFRKNKGYTLADLSELTGLSPSYISRLEASERRFNADLLSKFSAVLGCSEMDLLHNDANIKNIKEITYVPTKDLPVYQMIAGEALTGANGKFAVGDFSSPEGKVFRLPQLLGVESAFAFKIVDELNSPKYRVGDMLYINTQKLIARSEPVVVITTENSVIVGELINWDDSSVELKHFGKTEVMKFNKSELLGTYSVVCSFDKDSVRSSDV